MLPAGNNELLKTVFQKVFEFGSKEREATFLEELKLEMTPETAFFDSADSLPVTILKVVPHPTAARNRDGTMHAGAVCTMIDHLSTYSVFTDPAWWESDGTEENTHLRPEILKRMGLEFGLSRNIKMHLQRPVPLGKPLYFMTKVLENTQLSTYFFSQIFDEEGNLLATGHHDKVKLTKPVQAKI